ncbi:MAG TPA: MerR family transcriptional regulator [Actinomycetes bacterium]|jgi:DNA-binding transcriptional MerR regulator|nr:MerR family transcriptional regulator [Actinomycetes bacterium]
MQEPRWTLDELAERVDAALAVDYRGQPSGRVRAVPDRRAIRWYTTIGLIDRPIAHRGRTALYGPRHLLQLVAVKRLQAKGMPLVAIQQELAGATDTQLARVADLPSGATVPIAPVTSGSGSPSRLSALDGGRQTAGVQPAAGPPGSVAARARRADFWREPPAALTATAAPDPAAPVSTLRGIQLGEGTTLLLEPGRELDAADLQAILEAAGPLLAVLRNRGLGRTAGNQEPTPGPRLAKEHEPPLSSRRDPGPGGGREPRRERP